MNHFSDPVRPRDVRLRRMIYHRVQGRNVRTGHPVVLADMVPQ